MGDLRGASFDPETVSLMQAALEDALLKLPSALRTPAAKGELAVRILKRASDGERDPIRLRTAALLDFKIAIGSGEEIRPTVRAAG